MQAFGPPPARSGGSKSSLAALVLLAPLAAVAGAGGGPLLAGALIQLGVRGAVVLAAGRRGARRRAALFTWQQVHVGMERELRALKRSR